MAQQGTPENPGEGTASGGKVRSMGRRRQGAFQDFMARHLIMAAAAPLPVKVRLVAEAGQAITWGSDGPSAKIAAKFRELGSQALAIEAAFRWFDQEREVWSIRWLPSSIADDAAYREFFEPWDAGEAFEAYPSLMEGDRRAGSKAALDRLSKRDRFLVRTSSLTDKGLLSLKSVFYQFAQAPTMVFYGEIAKRVDPTIFEKALRASRGEL